MMGLFQVISNSSMLAAEWLEDIGNFVVEQLIGPILWGLCDLFFVILDMIESIFRIFAGTLEGGVSLNGNKVEGDLVLYLIQSTVVTEIFISMLILSFILLLMFTVFAVVKNQYSEKQEPVSKIIGASCKGLLMYLLVPVATVVCLLVGNIVLQAIEGATHVTGGIKASGILFNAASHNANKLRTGDPSTTREDLQYWYDHDWLNFATRDRISREEGITSSNIDTITTAEKMDRIATIIDEQFAQGNCATTSAYSFQLAGLGFSGIGTKYWSYGVVTLFYDAIHISYITIWIGGAFMIGAIGKIAWGVLARLFKLTIYYAISPVVIATYPIDNGGALGKWRSAVVQQTTSAYVAIGVTNILYSIIPTFSGVNIGSGLVGSIAKIIIVIIAFSSAKDLISTVSGWFGTGDAYAQGESAKGQFKSAVSKVSDVSKKMQGAAKTTAGTFAGIKAGRETAKKEGRGAWGQFWGGAKGAFAGSGLAEKTGLDPTKYTGKEGAEKAEKFVSGWDTLGKGERAKTRKANLEEANDREERAKKVAAVQKSFGYEYELDKYDEEALENKKSKMGSAAYREWYTKQKRLERALLAADPAGRVLYADDIADAEYAHEMAEKRVQDMERAKGFMDAYEDYATAYATYQGSATDALGIKGDLAATKALASGAYDDLIDAFYNGSSTAIDEIFARADKNRDSGGQSLGVMLDALKTNNPEQLQRLTELRDTMKAAEDAQLRELQNLNRELAKNGEAKEMYSEYGFVGSDGKVAVDALITGFGGVVDKLNEAASTTKAAADAWSSKAAGAVARRDSWTEAERKQYSENKKKQDDK